MNLHLRGPSPITWEQRLQNSSFQPCCEQEGLSPVRASQYLLSSLSQKHLAPGTKATGSCLAMPSLPGGENRGRSSVLGTIQSRVKQKTKTRFKKIINIHHHFCHISLELLAFKLWNVSGKTERKKCSHFLLNQNQMNSSSLLSQFCSHWCLLGLRSAPDPPQFLPPSIFLASVSFALSLSVKKRLQITQPESVSGSDGQLVEFFLIFL